MKTNLLNAFKQTLLHLIELGVIIAIGWVVMQLFPLTNDQTMIVIGLVLAGFAKFSRAIGLTPDFPNLSNSPTPTNEIGETEKPSGV